MVMSLAANAKKDNPPLLPVTVDLTAYKTRQEDKREAKAHH